MKPKASRLETGWDARNEFVRELVYRAHLWLNGSPQNLKEWFEDLRDFYSMACPFIEDRDKVKEDIRKIKLLIYGRVTESQHRQNLTIAYEMIRDLFEHIHIEVFKAGIYLPIYERDDPGKAIMNME